MKGNFWLVLVVASASFAQSQAPSPAPPVITQDQQNKTTEKKSIVNSDNRPPDKPPSSSDQSDTAEAGRDQKGNKAEDDKATSLDDHRFLGAGINDWLIVGFTAGLCLLGGLQFWAMHRQAAYMRRGLRISIKQVRIANRSVVAAKVSADTAEAAAKFAESTLRLTERADVLIDDFSLSRTDYPTHAFIKIRVKNFGKTRAEEVAIKWWAGVGSGDPPEHPLVLESGVIGPGGCIILQTKETLGDIGGTGQDWDSINQGTTEIIAAGRGTYRDIFKKEHAFNFLAVYDPYTRSFLTRKNESD